MRVLVVARPVETCRVPTILARRRGDDRSSPGLARPLRSSMFMTQARNAIARKIKGLLKAPSQDAGQKALFGWQGLPGAPRMEVAGCR